MSHAGLEQILVLNRVISRERLVGCGRAAKDAIGSTLGGKVIAVGVDRGVVAECAKRLPLENHAPSAATGLDGVVVCDDRRAGSRRRCQDIILYVVLAGRSLKAKPDADVASPGMSGIPDPALRHHGRIAQSRRGGRVIRIVRAAAREK